MLRPRFVAHVIARLDLSAGRRTHRIHEARDLLGDLGPAHVAIPARDLLVILDHELLVPTDAGTGVWKWRVKSNYPTLGAITPTAGGVVFFGGVT